MGGFCWIWKKIKENFIINNNGIVQQFSQDIWETQYLKKKKWYLLQNFSTY